MTIQMGVVLDAGIDAAMLRLGVVVQLIVPGRFAAASAPPDGVAHAASS
jgi:hypothetical protein